MKKKTEIELKVIPGEGNLTRSSNKVESITAAAKTDVERNVVKCWGVLEVAELTWAPGRDFGRAVIALRDEIKKNHKRNFLTRLKELEIPYAKARYWMAVIEGRPI